MEREKKGTYGWGVLAAFVLAWDVLAPETLTHAFERGLENPHTKPLLLGGLALTGAHLLGIIPRQYDPFYRLTDAVGQGLDALAQHVPLEIDLDNLTD